MQIKYHAHICAVVFIQKNKASFVVLSDYYLDGDSLPNIKKYFLN
jgi:hypothetical protein